MTWQIVLCGLLYAIGVVLAERELRLRHNGYEAVLCNDGKVRRFPYEEFDHESMKWAPALLSVLIYVPYRLYRIKHPVLLPTADELQQMYGLT